MLSEAANTRGGQVTAFTLCWLLTSLHLTNGNEEEEEDSDNMTQVCPGGGLSSYNMVPVSR